MTTLHARACTLALAVTLASPEARAQFTNPRRSGSPRATEAGVSADLRATQPIGLRDCADEVWTFNVAYPGEGTTVSSLQLWIGVDATSCNVAANRTGAAPTCWQIGARGSSISNPVVPFQTNSWSIPSGYLVDPVGGNCRMPQTSRGTVSTNYLSLVVATTVTTAMNGTAFAVPFDLDPPVAPTGVAAVPGEESVEISWASQTTTSAIDTDASTAADSTTATTTTTTVATDLQGYWIVCDPPIRSAGDAGASADAGDGAIRVPDQTFGGDGGSTSTCTGAFPALNPNDDVEFERYRRGPIVSPIGTRVVVGGLTNGVAYRCAVVAQDNAGNRSISSPSACIVPAPVTDFWERYRAQGGAARPIDCAVSPRLAGRDVWARGALALTALALFARRRRTH